MTYLVINIPGEIAWFPYFVFKIMSIVCTTFFQETRKKKVCFNKI